MDKTEGGVETLRALHARQGVEQQAGVTDGAGLRDQGLDQLPAKAAALVSGLDKKPFHLARVRVVRPQANAADRGTVVQRQQQAPARRGIGPGQAGQLLGEILEAKVGVDRCRILLKQPPDGGDVLDGAGLDDLHGDWVAAIKPRPAAPTSQHPPSETQPSCFQSATVGSL